MTFIFISLHVDTDQVQFRRNFTGKNNTTK